MWEFECGAKIGFDLKFLWLPAHYKIFEECRTALENGVDQLNEDLAR